MPLNKLRNKVQLRKITSLLQRVFPTSRFTAFGHKMSWRVTFAQSDQSLSLSHEYSRSVKLLTERHLEFRSLKGGCIGSPESTFVKIQHCWKSHVADQFMNSPENVPP